MLKREVIDYLFRVDGGKLLKELVIEAPENTRICFGKMSSALRDGNMEELIKQTHTLRSSTSYLGAVELARVCTALEVKARNTSDSKDLALHLDHVRQCLEETLGELNKTISV